MNKLVVGVLMLALLNILFLHTEIDRQGAVIKENKHTIKLLKQHNQDLEFQLNTKDYEIEKMQSEYKQLNTKYEKAVSRSASRTMTVQATAYTHTGNPTATGVMPKVGMIAVDPKVIPLGTKVYVEGYGYATATDTGGAIKGNIIDLFMNTKQECIQWGRRTVDIKILK